MAQATYQDTAEIFIESGALKYPWFTDVDFSDDPDNKTWTLTFVDPASPDGDASKQWTVTHQDVMRAVRKIAADKEFIRTTREPCQKLVFGKLDDVDFDDVAADWVLQVAAYGRVVHPG